MPSAMDKRWLNLRLRISPLLSCQNNKNNAAYLILLFLYTYIVAVIAEDFNYNIGGLKVFCPEPKDEWFNVGLNCFKRTNTKWQLGWENAQQLCRQSENNGSKLFELQDWFLHYELAQKITDQKTTDLEQAEFWTGWYVQSTADERLPRNILSMQKSVTKTKASVYNPLWAALEPQLLNVTEGRWCISWNANFQSPTQYGWRIQDCSEKLEVICQTFACFSDSDGKPQYRCQDNSGCIPRSSLCDHIQDCADNDDESEVNCNGNSKLNVVETKASYGNVYSPGFIVSNGNNISYSHNARSYEWRITQQPGTRIKLNFMAIDVDPHEDKLLVESIDSGEKFPVAAYKYPTSFLSSGSKIRIKYEPSKKARRKGFHLQYSTEDSSVCVRKFESWNGTFSPPRSIPDRGKYRSATDCLWTIDNFAEETISIRIPYFQLALGDWLAVYDGPIQNETLFANFSRTNQPPSAFLSQATEINFKFWAGPNTPGDEGFQIVFERSCEDQMVSSSFGSIESLNFRFKKRKPKNSYSCSWIIDVPCHPTLPNCAFTLFFDYLDLLNVDEINILEENKQKEVYIRSSVGMPQFVYHSNSSRAILSIKSMSDTFFSKITFSADCPDPSKVFGAFVSTLSARDTFPYRSKVDLTCAGQHHISSQNSNSARNQSSTLAHCEAGGKWDTAAMLTCKETKSEDVCVVPIIENGYPTKLNRDEGELFFECNFGFVNASVNPTTCINGNWTPEPSCKGELIY